MSRSLVKTNKPKKERSDNFTTPEKAYRDIKHLVPENIKICDPFWNDGKTSEYLSKVFPTCQISHDDSDAFDTSEACANGVRLQQSSRSADLIITNPPFTMKYQALRHLVDQDVKFMCIFPLMSITTDLFKTVSNYDQFQYLIPNKRINFEVEGRVSRSATWFACVWVCYKMDLPKQVSFL
jgi:DNA modification methylase